MLSALILRRDPARPAPSPEALVRGLAALIPAAVEGIIKDVVIAGPTGDPDLARIADHAGCGLVLAAPGEMIQAGLSAIRAPRVLVLLAGEVPGEGFFDEVSDRLTSAAETALVRRAKQGGWRDLLPIRAPVTGIIAPVALLRQSSPTDFSGVVRAARGAAALRTGTRSLA